MGRDGGEFKPWQSIAGFNSRARVGRDSYTFSLDAARGGFNSRARVGRDRRLASHTHARVVSTHAPAWGATCSLHISLLVKMFQLTRPRGARLLLHPNDVQRLNVSTHAPAWGATLATLVVVTDGAVSTHAPAWGATSRVLPQANIVVSFNSRARVGRDPSAQWTQLLLHGFNSRARVGRDCWKTLVLVQIRVSTHAPAWGATSSPFQNFRERLSFNSRARVGRDGYTF